MTEPSTSYSSTLGGVQDAPQTLSITYALPRADPDIRCPVALAYGQNGWWNTRCDHDVGHPRTHGGLGPEGWEHAYIEWFPGDSREYTTTRTDRYSWYEPPAPLELEARSQTLAARHTDSTLDTLVRLARIESSPGDVTT